MLSDWEKHGLQERLQRVEPFRQAALQLIDFGSEADANRAISDLASAYQMEGLDPEKLLFPVRRYQRGARLAKAHGFTPTDPFFATVAATLVSSV